MIFVNLHSWSMQKGETWSPLSFSRRRLDEGQLQFLEKVTPAPIDKYKGMTQSGSSNLWKLNKLVYLSSQLFDPLTITQGIVRIELGSSKYIFYEKWWCLLKTEEAVSSVFRAFFVSPIETLIFHILIFQVLHFPS